MHESQNQYDCLEHIDRIDTLIRESTAIADAIAECVPENLEHTTLTTLGSMLRNNLREFRRITRCLQKLKRTEPRK